MSVCPHPFDPDGHAFQPTRGSVEICKTCNGPVVSCPLCRQGNRSAARFCVHCGARMLPPRSASKLLPRQTIRDGFQTSGERTLGLSSLLNLPNGWIPFFWCGGTAGVFVFSLRESGPVRLDLIEGASLFVGRSRTLATNLPDASTWVTRPLLTEDGLFIVTRSGVEFFRAHGGRQPFERMSVPTPVQGGRIQGAGIDDRGVILLAISGPRGGVTAFASNGQGESWLPAAEISLTLGENDGAWIGGFEGDGTLWVLADKSLMLVRRSSGDRIASHSLPSLGGIGLLWRTRMANGLFDPLVIASGATETALIVHSGGREAGEGGQAQYLRIGDTVQPRILSRFAGQSWISVGVEPGSVLVGTGDRIQEFAAGQPRGNPVIMEGATDIPPLVASGWLAAIRPLQSASAMAAEHGAELRFFERPTHGGGGLEQSVSVRMKGVPSRGLPPLLIGGVMIVVTKAGRDHRLQVIRVAETESIGEV